MTLKPCPFCGHTEPEVTEPSSSRLAVFVFCPKCQSSGPPGASETLAQMQWNCRAEPEPEPEHE